MSSFSAAIFRSAIPMASALAMKRRGSALEATPHSRAVPIFQIVFESTIWSYCHQGVQRAPGVVQLCLESWRRLNPGWRMVVLDERSLADAVDMAAVGSFGRADMTVQKLAVLARLCLLRAQGGVWVDATLVLPHAFGRMVAGARGDRLLRVRQCRC